MAKAFAEAGIAYDHFEAHRPHRRQLGSRGVQLHPSDQFAGLHGLHRVPDAAIDGSAWYVDSTGEPPFIRTVFEHYGPHATVAGLIPAFGYDFVPGNLAAALALAEAGETAVRV
ncbi:MAG: hypothetical protein ACRDSE_11230, partial [Pseudonocardiaceae bacterium]